MKEKSCVQKAFTTVVHFNVTAEEKMYNEFFFVTVSEMKHSPFIPTCRVKCGWRLAKATAPYINVQLLDYLLDFKADFA